VFLRDCGCFDNGDPGDVEAALVPGKQFGQDLADLLRLAAATVLDVADAVLHGFSPGNCIDYTEYYTFVN
jgi:hypothetical protein